MKRTVGRKGGEITASLMKPLNDSTGWHARHVAAWRTPKGCDAGLIKMIEGLAEYADALESEHGWKIEDDGYCGPYYEAIGDALIKLLSGPTSRQLDLGTVDALIRRMGACSER